MSEKTNDKASAEASKPAGKQAVVVALKTPVRVPGATLAKGGRVTIDLATAEHKEKLGEVAIEQVL